MRLALDPFRLLLISLAGWLNQRQQDVRRLAVRAENLGWRLLSDLTTIVTLTTLLAWHRWLIAR
jgi:hypothetical protein